MFFKKNLHFFVMFSHIYWLYPYSIIPFLFKNAWLVRQILKTIRNRLRFFRKNLQSTQQRDWSNNGSKSNQSPITKKLIRVYRAISKNNDNLQSHKYHKMSWSRPLRGRSLDNVRILRRSFIGGYYESSKDIV